MWTQILLKWVSYMDLPQIYVVFCTYTLLHMLMIRKISSIFKLKSNLMMGGLTKYPSDAETT